MVKLVSPKGQITRCRLGGWPQLEAMETFGTARFLDIDL
jgi:hypothetical protein